MLRDTEQLVKSLSHAAIQNPIEVDFGGKIKLQGYNISATTVTPGSTLNLTFFWQAIESIQKNYHIFLHVRDHAGNLVTQFDYEPFYGNYPTQHWQPGQNLIDSNEVEVSSNLLPGEYNLVIGFYDPTTLERLPVINDQSGENAFFLTPVLVEE